MAWTVSGNIKGPTGAAGAKGDKGDTGTAGSGVTIRGSDTWTNIQAKVSPVSGDMWILSVTDATAPSPSGGSSGGTAGDGIVWSGTAWTNAGPIRGPAGVSATVTAGTATGLAAGASPTITNSGSGTAAVFNFGIPAGAQGVQGNTGTTGAAATATAGSATALAVGAAPTVSNSGTSSAAVFNFGIPAGAKGDQGTVGTAGTRGSNWYTGSGAPGAVTGSSAGDQYLDVTSGDVYTLA